jgi:glycosyltransferase involved in cell wall biosynthesis
LEGHRHFDVVHFLDVHFAFAYTGPFIATMFQSFRQRLVSGGRFPYYSTPANLVTRLVYYNLARRWMEPISLRRATHLIASSHATRDEFITHYQVPPEKIDTIPLGVDVDRFKPQPAIDLRRSLGLEDVSLLLFVGFATARKGLEYLAEALLLLDPSVRLLFIGRWEPGYRDRFYRVLGDAADRVIELGYVPDADLPAYYCLADLFVLPSLLEGFGLPIVEAMSSGTPVVATQAGSIPDVVGDAGYLVPPRDPRALADAIKQLLEDGDLRKALARAGRDRARVEFSLSKMVASTADCYKQHTRDLRP